MSRDVITVGLTMRILLLYRGEYSQWRERFMNYLEEQMDGEAMNNSIQNGDQPLPVIAQMHGSEYGEKDRKAAIFYEYETFKDTEREQLLDTYLCYLQYGTLVRQTRNLIDINIDALYNILKQNKGDVNDALGYKKKAVVVTSNPLALVAEKTKVTKRKEKVEVQLESEESDDEDISDLKKIIALLAKAFNRNKYYAKPSNNNLRTSSASSFANKKQNPLALVAEKTKVSKRKEKFVVSLDSEGSDADEFSELKNITALLAKAFNRRKFYSKPTNNNLRTSSTSQSANKKQEFVKHFANDCKKEKVKDYNYYKTKMLLAKKDSNEQVLLIEDQAWMESSNDSDQEINANMVFMAQIKKVLSDSDERSLSAEETIAKKRIEKANQQSKDLENQNKYLQEKYDVLINQVNTFEEQNNEFNEQMNVLNEKNADLLAQTKGLQDQLKVKHVVIDTDVECQAQYAKLEEERYEYMIRYSALCDNDKQHRKKIDEQEILFDKMNLDTFSSVRRPKQNSVIWKNKGSFNTSNVDLSSVSHSKLNKDVKRYSRKDLLSCNNCHLGETSCAYVCNDAMNVSCNSRLCDSFDENNLFIFDDESVRISPVSKMPFRKKHRDSLNVRSKHNSNQSLPRTVHRWLPKMQLLAEPAAKWIPIVER
nr:hypothetical protein [Tanacetum cinerariifolium]